MVVLPTPPFILITEIQTGAAIFRRPSLVALPKGEYTNPSATSKGNQEQIRALNQGLFRASRRNPRIAITITS